ncbi:MAG: serine/threonine protein kinase [Deltaproteobacteria bacterium]|nr:serine/threonine protein kinase [Deltaproteobacteria bacterium]
MIDVGRRVGDYEVVARLKAGGMATLYLARRHGAAGFSRHVAIKIVHPHLSEEPNFREMFVDEALLSARIDHPNVVRVEELGEVEGTYFLVMEYVHGCSLGTLSRELAARKRRLSPEIAVHIITRVADGLHAAHETLDDDGHSLGIVHRDVSPPNILLSYRGEVKLIDFGIAKARGRRQQTATGEFKGKFSYMSPEQACALPVDRRTDVYALGILLWEMIAGRRLFDAADDVEVLERVRKPYVPAPSTITPTVGPDLDAVVLDALAFRKEARPQTALELRQRLLEALPSAASIDHTHVAALLAAVLGDYRDEQARALPESLTGIKTNFAPGVAAGADMDWPTDPELDLPSAAKKALESLSVEVEVGAPPPPDEPVTQQSPLPAAVTRRGSLSRRASAPRTWRSALVGAGLAVVIGAALLAVFAVVIIRPAALGSETRLAPTRAVTRPAAPRAIRAPIAPPPHEPPPVVRARVEPPPNVAAPDSVETTTDVDGGARVARPRPPRFVRRPAKARPAGTGGGGGGGPVIVDEPDF